LWPVLPTAVNRRKNISASCTSASADKTSLSPSLPLPELSVLPLAFMDHPSIGHLHQPHQLSLLPALPAVPVGCLPVNLFPYILLSLPTWTSMSAVIRSTISSPDTSQISGNSFSSCCRFFYRVNFLGHFPLSPKPPLNPTTFYHSSV